MSTINADTLTVQNLTVSGTLSYESVTAQASLPAVPSPGTTLETLVGLCDGRSITVASGTYTMPNVTSAQTAPGTFTQVTGSNITYTPPAGTKRVVYEFNFTHASVDANGITYFKYRVDGVDVSRSFFVASDNSGHDYVHFLWEHTIGDGDDADTGKFDTWTSGKTLDLVLLRHGTSNEGEVHGQYYTSAFNTYHTPKLRITAIA